MFVNVWMALSDAAQDIVIESLRWDEETQGDYTGPLRNRSRRLFEYMQQDATRRRLWISPTLAGTVYNLWSIDFNDEGSVLQEVRDEIDFLIAEYPNQISVLGAWKETGEQFGTEHVYTTTVEEVTYSILNPDYDPNEFLDDEVTPNPDYDPNYVIRVTEDQDVTRITGKTGTAEYPLPDFLWRFLPNPLPDGTIPASNADLVDINLLFGQRPRSFF